MNRIPLILLLGGLCSLAQAADPWADRVVDYIPGSNPQPGYQDTAAPLGSPSAISTAFGGYVVSPFSPPAGTDEVISIGEGGQLTVAFDEPVTNDPNNPFGIDLLIFGNSFFSTNNFLFDHTTVVSGIQPDGGAVWISDDGMNFTEVTGAVADGMYPTNGFADTVDFFPTAAGNQPADFTRPVNPAWSPVGLGAADVVAGYQGSGGGAGIDIGQFGFLSISHVRITNPVGSIGTPEIDAFADVRAIPEPTTLRLLAISGWLTLIMRRTRRDHHSLDTPR